MPPSPRPGPGSRWRPPTASRRHSGWAVTACTRCADR